MLNWARTSELQAGRQTFAPTTLLNQMNNTIMMTYEIGPGGNSLPIVGIVIAVISSFINGSTFVLQKKGILRARDRGRLIIYFS